MDGSKPTGRRMNVNLVQHKAVELPRDQYGNVVSEERYDAGGLEIPLAVGPLRDLPALGDSAADKATAEMVVDVVLHPSIIVRCAAHNMFLDQVACLAMDTVVAESGVKLHKRWKLNTSKYVGGRGADKSTPALFPVDHQEHHEQQRKQKGQGGGKAAAAGTAGSLADPTNIVNAVLEGRSADKGSSSGPDIPSLMGGGGGGASPKKESIFNISAVAGAGTGFPGMSARSGQQQPAAAPKVVDVSVPVAKAATAKAASTKSSKPLVKKGFFDNAKDSLYDEKGSGEGVGHNTGGTYTKFMSRCTVVDPAQGSVTQPTQPFGAPPPPPAAAPAPAPAPAPAAKAKVLPGKGEVRAMEDLLSSVDKEWTTGQGTASSREVDSWQAGNMLADMQKVMEGVEGVPPGDLDPAELMAKLQQQQAAAKPPMVPAAATKSVKAAVAAGAGVATTVRSSFPPESLVVVKEKTDAATGRRSLSVKIHEVRGISSLADDSVSLQVSEQQLLFSTGPNKVVTVSLDGSCVLDASNVTKASYSKKKGLLSVEVGMT